MTHRMFGGTGPDADASADEVDHIVEPPKPKPAKEVALPEQHDAPHVFRFHCPSCTARLSLFGRAANWFIKTLE